jgi:DNA ligase D-like protein (predicted ligase)
VKAKAKFIEPMLLEPTTALPDDPKRYEYGIKLDGYRAIAFKTGGKVSLRSRNDNDFSRRYGIVLTGLAGLPDETVIDGEIVALDEEGRPSFMLLSQWMPGSTPILYYVFDVMMLAGRDLTREPFKVRRDLLRKEVLPTLTEPVRYAEPVDVPLDKLIASVKQFGFEGVVGKRLDSPYEPGLRTGKWQKLRVNQSQEFVIGGYTIGTAPFDALILGYYEGEELHYVARTRSGFTPAMRAQIFKKFRGLEIKECPFVNLPETKSGRFGQGLTKEKMSTCRWLKPTLVAQIEYVEWTEGNHLRHTKFIGLRDDKDARDVRHSP